jgi:hypothetical protein
MIVEVPLPDEVPAVPEVAPVDVDAGDLEVLGADQIVVSPDHDSVADAYIEYPGPCGEVLETVLITHVRHVVDYELVEIIDH